MNSGNSNGGKQPSFGGFRKDSKQPKSGWTSAGAPVKPGSGNSSSGFGKKWKSTCSSCGGKM